MPCVSTGVRADYERGSEQVRDLTPSHRAPGLLKVAAPWLPVGIGVVIMIALFAAASLWRPAPGVPTPPVGLPAPSTGAQPSAPGVGVSGTGGPALAGGAPSVGTGSGAARPVPTRPARSPSTPSRPPPDRGSDAVAPQPVRPSPRPPAPAPEPAPAPAPVTGSYRLVDSFADGFIGEVRVVNRSGRAANWEVAVVFSAAVTDLRASWVDGFPAPTVRRTGQLFVFTGAGPVAAGGAAPLRFHVSRAGRVVAPDTCAVNGTRCAGTG